MYNRTKTINPMKNELNFVLTKENLILNGLELSKEDCGLLLELQGHEVDYSMSSRRFFMNALISFGRLPVEDFFEVFDDFVCWDEETKNSYRGIVSHLNNWLPTGSTLN